MARSCNHRLAVVSRCSALLLAFGAGSVPIHGKPPGPEVAPDEADIPEGAMLIHGDIIVPADFYDQPESTFDTNTWPDGIVYFEFDANVTVFNQVAMLMASHRRTTAGRA